MRKKAQEIEENHEGLAEIIENMWETMYYSDGVWLAAPQVGLSIRIFIIYASPAADEDHGL